MKKVLICDPIAKEAVTILKKTGFEVTEKTGLSEADLVSCIGDYNAIIVRSATKVTRKVIEAGKKLEVIARGGVGVDNIDMAAAKEKGIPVVNTPKAPSISVAEHTFALLFALARSIPQADATTKAGKWEKKKFKGFELYGKTLGLIGIGRIGQEVAVRAMGLGMKVITYDPFGCATATIHAPQMDSCDLGKLIREADIITLHVPLTDATRGMIGGKEIASMKDGVVIVNCARGGVVDEKALLEGLTSGKVRGACLDVFEKEPPADNPLLKLDNVVVTPHIASQTAEGQFRVGTEVAALVVEKLQG
ncbi:MAG: hydroxyacid dehydrogenase [Candidatus Aureabacteria bacterium]|nr:hydroxyacid dehydrogenase [Candidatus Auribacterota bacterium]